MPKNTENDPSILMAICVFAKRKTLLNYKHGGEGGLQEERGEKTLILSEVLLSLNGCCRPVQAAGALVCVPSSSLL